MKHERYTRSDGPAQPASRPLGVHCRARHARLNPLHDETMRTGSRLNGMAHPQPGQAPAMKTGMLIRRPVPEVFEARL
jgi:hypothetical protein